MWYLMRDRPAERTKKWKTSVRCLPCTAARAGHSRLEAAATSTDCLRSRSAPLPYYSIYCYVFLTLFLAPELISWSTCSQSSPWVDFFNPTHFFLFYVFFISFYIAINFDDVIRNFARKSTKSTFVLKVNSLIYVL